MAGNTIQWNTILSLPMKCTILVSGSFHQVSQLSGSSSFVLEIYPIGASNQTYSTFPSAPSTGTGIPQSRSRLTARGCNPISSQLLHCPYTFGFHSLCPSSIHWRRNGSHLSKGRYQCLVSFITGWLPLIADFGLIRSVGLKEVPQASHWSP